MCRVRLALGIFQVLAMLLCLFGSSAALADGDIRTVALSGRPLPGFGDDIVSHNTVFSDFVLNNLGQVAYSAQLTGPGFTVESYWRYTPGQGQELLARSGDPAPGRPGEYFIGTLGPVSINDAGDVQLRSHLAGGTNNLGGYLGDWVWSPAGITKLAFINEQTPQIGHYFQSIGSAINNTGQQIRGAQVLPAAGALALRQDSLWLLDPNAAPMLLAKVGDPAPGLPNGITLATQFSGSFLTSGKILYRMGLAGSGVTTTNKLAFWQGDNQGNYQLIFRGGQPAPGVPGLVMDPSSYVFVREAVPGSLQVQTLLQGPGVVSSNNLAFWSYDEGGLKLLAREGNQAPGLANGVVFAQLSPVHQVMGPGIDSSNDTGLWLQQHGGFELVAREGEHAPGTPDGVIFASSSPFGSETFTSNVVQNKSEQFAFLANLGGAGVTADNDVGLWASDLGGVLHLIARESQTVDVDDGPGIDLRTIASIDLRQSDAIGKYLNDRGQVLFKVAFTDGAKGLFLSDLVAVPEPPTAAYLTCAIAVTVLWKKKRNIAVSRVTRFCR